MKPAKKNINVLALTIAFGLMSWSLLFSQNSEDLEVTSRLAQYEKTLSNLAIDEEMKADSAYYFAQFEFKKANYQQARDLCEIALKFRPNWGNPHLLIGKCYASSGVVCDPSGRGAGWDAQVLLWAAFDEWEAAISVDDSAEIEARQLMSKYASYFPEETTCKRLHSLAEGDEYFVKCWVQRKTKVRLKP
jgi:tetratricopeptide (TPR) repeat protein